MELKVRAVEAVEEKSIQEVEEQLLEQHEQKFSEETIEEEAPQQEEQPEYIAPELSEDDVLSFIKNKYGRDINSLDELTAVRESEELPEDVSAYFKYKKETGRGIEDFVKLNKNIDDLDSDTLLKEYFFATEEGLDAEDIESMMEDFMIDEEFDEESDVKKKKIARKKTIAKAKKYFEEQKEKYRVPLESRGSSISESEAEEIQAYKQYIESAKTYEEESNRKRDWFHKKTDDVFGSEFKGFEFTLDDKKIVFSPGDAAELKKIQSNPQSFISKYLDESGMISDAVGYHRSLSLAMNPDKFAKFFYEQGKAEATDDVMRKTKNINMSERSTPQVTSKGGFQVKSLNDTSGRGLKIKSKN